MDDKHQLNQLGAAISFTMLSLFCREIFVLHANWSGKFLFLVVLFWGFLISISYNAILTSVLTYSTPKFIGSLEEILISPDYTILFRASGTTRGYFENAPDNSTGNI